MHNLHQLMNTLPIIADTSRSQPTSILWIAIPVAAVGTIALFWWLSRRAERAVHDQLTQLAAQEVARWLQKPLNTTQAEILPMLTAPTVPDGFATQYDRLIDFVFLDIERENSTYFFNIRIEKNESELLNSRCQITYDDLPVSVQTAFLKGETYLRMPWFPNFQQQSQTTTARA